MSSLLRGLGIAPAALLSALLGAMPAAGKPHLTVLYQATPDDGNSAGSLDQPLSVSGGGVIVEAQGPSGSVGLVLLLTPSGLGQRYNRTVLHNFTDACSSDGGYPSGRLTADKSGNVWGMTNRSCGVPGGTVFELVRPPKGGSWTYKEVLQMPTTFSQDIAGGGYDDLLFDPHGNLYGLLRSVCQYICSPVFEISAATLAGGNAPVQTLYEFPDAGGLPTGLVRDKTGNLFGVKNQGGSAGMGEVWEVSPPAEKGGSWTGADIYDFCTVVDQYGDCPDGATPTGAPAVDVNGALYGTAYRDGAGPQSGNGTIWVMQPSGGTWSYSVIHELYSAYPQGGQTPDYAISNPMGDTLLSPTGQVLTELNQGGWVGPMNNQTIVQGGILGVSPQTQADLLLAKNAFPAFGVQAGPYTLDPTPIIGSLTMDKRGNLYGASNEYYDPVNGETPAVIFKVTN